jgi:hypothetical protein
VSRLERRPVAVAADPRGRPVALRQGRTWRRVAEVLEEWVYREPWWERSFLDGTPGAAPERLFYRVRLQDGAVVELQRRGEDGRWLLHRTFD